MYRIQARQQYEVVGNKQMCMCVYFFVQAAVVPGTAVVPSDVPGTCFEMTSPDQGDPSPMLHHVS